MKRRSSIWSVLTILCASACLDRIDIDIGDIAVGSIVVNGSITNDPGPYQVLINSAFDIDSKESFKNPLTAERVIISDNTGLSEELTEASKGIYITRDDGIQGIVGRTYTLRVEFADGRIYESVPDTLFEAGRIDSLYTVFSENKTPDNVSEYGFDVMFMPSISTERDYHLMWKFSGTFQAETYPEMTIDEPCGVSTCEGCNRCNFKPLCSGLRNMSPLPGIQNAIFVRVGPCECCTCWYDFFNAQPLLNDDQFVEKGRFTAQKAATVPIDPWLFKHRVYAKVSQFTLSRQAFDFWRAVKDQKTAVNSLFQPITGKVKTNFTQLAGPAINIEGLFFAAGVANNAMFIDRNDVPALVTIPEPLEMPISCMKLFPFATTQKPDFWE